MSNDSSKTGVGLNNSSYEEKVKSLHTGAVSIGLVRSLNELYNAIIAILTETLGYPMSGLAIPDGQYMHFVRTLHESHGTDFSLPLDSPSISVRAYKTKETQIVNDVRLDPDYYAGPQGSDTGPQVLSSLVVPVLVDDEVRAILNLESTNLNNFAQLDAEILEILGMHISSAFTRIDQHSELYESEARVQAIMNQAADAIILMDIKDKIIFWNPASERLFGYQLGEALDKTFFDLLVPDSFKEKYVENRKQLLGMGLDNDLPSMECVCQKKNGEQLTVEVSHSVIQYDGKPHVLRMLRDASERKGYEKRLRLLYEHASNLSTAKRDYDIFEITRAATEEVFGVNHGSIALVEGDYLVFPSDRPRETWWRSPLDGKGISIRAVRTGETQFVQDTRLDPDYIVDTTDEYKETRAELDVPIMIENDVVGVFNIESPIKDRFTQNDVQLAEILAENIASTLRRVQAYEMTKRYEEELESLHKSAVLLNDAITKEELFASTIQIIKDVLNTHWVGIAEPVEEGMLIALASEYNMEEDFILPYDAKSIVLRAYHNRKTVFVEDISKDPDYVSVEQDVEYVSELVVPVFVGNEIKALINVESTNKGEIADPEKSLVEILAIYMGSAIERISREKELRESEERISVISQNAVDAIFVVNKDRDFVIWNPSTEKMFELSKEEFSSKKLETLMVPEERWPQFYEEFNGIIERKMDSGSRVLESVAMKADGTEIQVGFTASVIELDGEPHALFIMRDITEQKAQRDKIVELLDQMRELNIELERSNQDLENYTYVVSHDLKAPLRSIRSFGGFIQEDYTDALDDEGKEYLERIINAATHMDDLIGDLLLLSRVGRKFTEEESIDLNELMTSIEEDIYATIEERNASIDRSELPIVKGQKTWVRQLLMNLITNGLKFNISLTPTITIGVDEAEKEYTFSVKDNGIGIAEEYHDKIFALFERLHTKTDYEGTGAGLTICKRIVENFGGKIWVESEEGQGSTFYFTYPKEGVGAS